MSTPREGEQDGGVPVAADLDRIYARLMDLAQEIRALKVRRDEGAGLRHAAARVLLAAHEHREAVLGNRPSTAGEEWERGPRRDAQEAWLGAVAAVRALDPAVGYEPSSYLPWCRQGLATQA